MQPSTLIEKWSASGAAESSNAHSFTNDLCDLLGVAHPDPTTPVEADNAYVFEKRVTGRNGNTKFIDCYKRCHFVLENKQGADAGTGKVAGATSATRKAQLKAGKTGHGKRDSKTWDTAMEKARNQAENYACLLTGNEIAGGRPANEAQKVVIRDLAERLDAHRKRQQSLHPKLTMTGMYNVLEKERAGEVLTEKERKIHNDGLVGILRELHDELNAAVAQAYGWPVDLPEAEILQRLVDLNAERAAEEARGHVRWLRPEYQAPEEAAAVQSTMDLGDAPAVVVTEKRKWDAKLPKAEKFVLLRDLLASAEGPLSLAAIADAFKPKLNKKRLAEVEGMLGAMEVLGQADGAGGVWRG